MKISKVTDYAALSHPGTLGFMLHLKLKILGENNARGLLKSVQNLEIFINNMSVKMSDYFINTFCIKRKSYFQLILKISMQNFE